MGAALAPSKSVRERGCCSQSLVPGRQVKAVTAHPHPPPRERKPKVRTAAAGHSVILSLHGPCQVSEVPSRPRRPGARLTLARLLPPPGPRKAKFLSRPRQRLLTRRPAGPAACSRRLRSQAPGLGRVGDRGQEPGPVNPGGKQKPGEDEQARPPRLRERVRGGERLPLLPGCAPPEGSTGPAARRSAEGPRSGAGDPSAPWPRGFTDPTRREAPFPG